VKRVYLVVLLLLGFLFVSSSQAHFSSGVVHVEYTLTESDLTALENLHRVQLAIERYAMYNPSGEYPPDLQILVEEGYLDGYEWPHNPYAKGNPGVFLRMHQVEIGNFMPGGIIYYPFEVPGFKGLSAYNLSVYGATPDSGRDYLLGLITYGDLKVKLEGGLILLSSYPEPRGCF